MSTALVVKYQSYEAAQQDVRKARDEYLVKADVLFGWGRFIFIGDPTLLAEIRTALSGRTVSGPVNTTATVEPPPTMRVPIEETRPATHQRPTTPETSPVAKPKTADPADGLKSKVASERVKAAQTLAAMGERAKPFARALCETAIDDNKEVRLAAIEALEKIQPEIVKPVLTLLTDQNHFNTAQAASQLGRLGDTAQSAIPVLVWYAKRPSSGLFEDREHVNAGMAALIKVGRRDPDAVQVVVDVASDQKSNASTRINALQLLGGLTDTIGPLRKKILDCLLNVLGEQAKANEQIALMAVIVAVGNYGADAKAAMPVLRELRLHSDIRIRNAAVAAIGKLEK
jgi:HEAT repeat protein